MPFCQNKQYTKDHHCWNQYENFYFSSRLQVEFASPSQLQVKPQADKLGFGVHFTDHILRVRWSAREGWGDPKIGPMEPFQMHPAAKVGHKFSFLWPLRG